MLIFSRKSKCPYCGVQLDDPPKRKAKCPECKRIIYIRSGKLVTEDEAQTMDWLGYLEQFDITRHKFDSERDTLSKRFNTKASVRDTIWSILNSLVATHPVQAYYEMARLVSQEGKDEQPYIEQALHALLISYKNRKIAYVRVECYGGEPDYSTCPGCAKLHQKKFLIDEALEKMPIPHCCTSDTGCRCTYKPA